MTFEAQRQSLRGNVKCENAKLKRRELRGNFEEGWNRQATQTPLLSTVNGRPLDRSAPVKTALAPVQYEVEAVFRTLIKS